MPTCAFTLNPSYINLWSKSFAVFLHIWLRASSAKAHCWDMLIPSDLVTVLCFVFKKKDILMAASPEISPAPEMFTAIVLDSQHGLLWP